MNNALSQFKDAIRAAGLEPPAVIEPGKFHRFPGVDKSNGNTAGWCYLFDDALGGCFGDWSSGLSETRQATREKPFSPSEQADFMRRVKAARERAEVERQQQHAEAAAEAAAIWKEADPANDDHPYLVSKRIKANGARLHQGKLVITVRSGNEIHSLQFIAEDGSKRFLSGGRIRSNYFSIGTLQGADALCIAEGFATGATIHQATGYPVVVAFNAGNLEPVAKALRQKLPDPTIIICADDDADTESNPGITKENQAALAISAKVAVPDFGVQRPGGATDFNDMAELLGLEAVAGAIRQATAPDPEASATFPPPEGKRPGYRVLDDGQEGDDGRRYPPGVYFCGTQTQKNGTTTPVDTWICSPLHVDAVTHDGQKDNFGRLLRFKTTLNEWREWAMPMEMLKGYGEELRGALLAMGVNLDPNHARKQLAAYLQWRTPTWRMRCAMQTGWAGAGSFVLPDTVIGPTASDVTFQTLDRGHVEYTTAGTLDGWQKEIAARAVGNPLLMLALSVGFAGPLLQLTHAESGGVHFTGDSSTGKSISVEAACALWGSPHYKRSWNTTANGMEGVASLFNDCLLALDEIGECDAREVGRIIYALGNGVGKQRANRSGAARSLTRWRCAVLSSGEVTTETMIHEGGGKIKAGQTVRLVIVRAARAYGAFDHLHGSPDGATFANAIRQATTVHYGHAGRTFLEQLTQDNRDWSAGFEQAKALPIFSQAAEGQAKRVAARFALYGMAGELATEYGLTGWPTGDAFKAAGECFRLWLDERGHDNDEKRKIIEQVCGFIDRHGDARFSNAKEMPSDRSPIIRDRAGWWQDTEDGRVYLFTSDGMREALKGTDLSRGLDALQDEGMLPTPKPGSKRLKSERIAGHKGTKKVYPITIKAGGHES